MATKKVLKKIIKNGVEYELPTSGGGGSSLDINEVNGLIDYKVKDCDSLFKTTSGLYKILNSIDDTDELGLTAGDTWEDIVGNDTSMSKISHCYAVMCNVASSEYAMSKILEDSSATDEVSECWNSISIIADNEKAKNLYLNSYNGIINLLNKQVVQDAFGGLSEEYIISNIVVSPYSWKIGLKWKDQNISFWNKTVVRYSTTAFPEALTDGTLGLESTTKDEYSENYGYIDSLDSGTNYYITIFSLDSENNIIYKAYEEVSTYEVMTVVWNETEDPSESFVRYEDNAYGKTRGSSDFDTFFGYSAVIFSNKNDTTKTYSEISEVKQSSPGVLDISTLVSSTSNTRDLMIKFPRRGIKMSATDNDGIQQIKLSITACPDDNDFQYYAHSYGTLSQPIAANQFYLGAYKGYYVSVSSTYYLKSRTGVTPNISVTNANLSTYARNNGYWSNGKGFGICGFYQREYVNCLYMIKYGNIDCKNTVGNGVTSGSTTQTTGLLNSETSATYGTTEDTTTQMKLFGLEARRGGTSEWICGIYTSSTDIYTALGTRAITTSDTNFSSVGKFNNISNGNLKSIMGGSNTLFVGKSGTGETTYETYYKNRIVVSGNSTALVGGSGSNGSQVGIFYLNLGGYGTSQSYNNVGARLMYVG